MKMKTWKRTAAVCAALLFTATLGFGCACNETYRGVMSPAYSIKEEDFQTLKDWNVNLMRRQFTSDNWANTNTDLDCAEYERWLEGKCNELDKELAWADKYGVKIILDLHMPPGGRLSNMCFRMFYEEKYADEFVKVWQMMAKRYKGDKRIIAYDLINEPVIDKNATISFRDLQIRAAKAIREIDPDKTLIFEVDGWDNPGNFKGFEKVDMDNVIYQAHMYIPHAFTHQGVGNDKIGIKYPGMINGEYWDRAKLAEALKDVREFQLKNNAKIYIGEFSAINWAEGADRYIADCISLFEEYGWDWSFHAFREWDGWSVEHVCEPAYSREKRVPSNDNPRKRALLNGFKLNRKPLLDF